jgi:hypothetical protein
LKVDLAFEGFQLLIEVGTHLFPTAFDVSGKRIAERGRGLQR